MSDYATLADLLLPELIDLNITISSKKKLLEHMAAMLAAHPSHNLKPKEIYHLLLEREKMGNTGIGEGIALPHNRCQGLQDAVLAIVSLDNAIDYDSIDNQPVNIAFGLLVPVDANDQHLTLLSKIATLVREPGRKDALLDLRDGQQLIDSIKG
ncbi:MAG: PTS sugar transporter subunit IIA [Pseudomonadota bacterium]